MPRTVVRTMLACVPLTVALLLVSPGVLVTSLTSPAVAAVPARHQQLETLLSGFIRSIGLNGPDRLTRAAVAEAMLPDLTGHEVPPPTSAEPPAAVPTVSRPAPAPPAVPAVPPAVPPAPAAAAVGGAAGQEFTLVNQDRAQNGVRGLTWSATLARVAQFRAQDMLNRGYFSHYDPATGQLAFVELFHQWGIGYVTAGENIAWSTDPSMVAINTMFMNSPEHRDNILNPGYGQLGVGVASNGTKVMVVEVFSN